MGRLREDVSWGVAIVAVLPMVALLLPVALLARALDRR